MIRRSWLLLPLATVVAVLVAVQGIGGAGAQTSPNDPKFASQYGPVKVAAPQAWDVTRGSAAVKVAVVDTGILSTLSDLQGQLVPGYNAITPGGSTDDDFGGYGIGTTVAGILGAKTNNGADMAGISWNIGMMPIKVCDFGGTCHAADVAEGIDWAVANGAQIIDISLGLATNEPLVAASVANAVNRGVIVVAATGNVATRVGYPAALPGVIGVGATDGNDVVTSFSGRGADVDIVAPGLSIMTLVRGGCCLQRSGTELAAGHVSGALALMLAAGVSPEQAKSALLQGVQDLGPAGWDAEYGHGRLDICASLSRAGVACPLVTPTATATGTNTPVPPTATNTPVPPTATPTRTNTPVPPTATPTRTNTPVPPTATPTPTWTSVAPTATWTPQPATATWTATPTRTNTPLPATATPTPGGSTETYSGRLRTSSRIANRAVALTAGDVLTATAAWGQSSSNVGLYLYNPAGQLVATGSGGSGMTQITRYVVPASGTYTVRLQLLSGKSASYVLTLRY